MRGWREFVVGAALAVAGMALIFCGMPELAAPPFDRVVAPRAPGNEDAAAPDAAREPRRWGWTLMPPGTGCAIVGEAADRRRQRIPDESGRDAVAFPGWDLRVVLAEMANSQRGLWPKPCFCSTRMIGKGPR